MLIHHPHSSITQVTRGVEYDVSRMTWFPQIARDMRIVAVRADSDISDWAELSERLQDSNLRIGVTGPTDLGTINMYRIGDAGGFYDPSIIPKNIVSYDGFSGVIQGMLRGDVQIYAGAFTTARQFIEAGDLRPLLFTTADSPPPEYSDYPTLTSIGLGSHTAASIADMVNTRRVFCGPPGIPDDRASTLRSLLTTVIRSDELRAEARESDRPIQYEDSARMGEIVSNGLRSWKDQRELIETITTIAGQ